VGGGPAWGGGLGGGGAGGGAGHAWEKGARETERFCER
jgi:hypothetical protein